MARTAPVPNIPAIPGMNPGVFVMGGGGAGGGSGGKGGKGRGGRQGANGDNGGDAADGAGGAACSGRGNCEPTHPNHSGAASRGDPVEIASGRTFVAPPPDLSFGGPLAFVFRRHYSSDRAEHNLGLGHGWSHSFAWVAVVRRRSIEVTTGDGATLSLSLPQVGDALLCTDGWVVKRHDVGIELVDVDGLRYRFGHPLDHQRFALSELIDAYENRCSLRYDGARLEAITDSVGRLVRLMRDARGMITSIVASAESPGGAAEVAVHFRYAERGDLVGFVDADGHETSFFYDDEHRLIRHRYPTGLVVHYRYDSLGRCVETWGAHESGLHPWLHPDLPTVLSDGVSPARGILHCKFEYPDDELRNVIDSSMLQRHQVDADGNSALVAHGPGVVTRTVDENGHLASYTDPTGATITWKRDVCGRPLQIIDANGGVTLFERALSGALTEHIDPAGGVTKVDMDGPWMRWTDPIGATFAMRVDDRGLLAETIAPNGSRTVFERDHHGNMVRRTNGLGKSWTYRYDAWGRCVQEIGPDGGSKSYRYSSRGDLLDVRGPDGGTVRFTRDGLGNLTSTTYPNGMVERYHWCGLGWLHQVERGGVIQATHLYDREGQLLEIQNAAGGCHRFIRDHRGLVIAETTFEGASRQYSYDLAGRVTSLVDECGDRTTFEYDHGGRLVSKVYGDDSVETYGYDPCGRITTVERGRTKIELRYNAAGWLVEDRQTLDGKVVVTSLEYDSMGNVVRRRTDGCEREAWEHDAAGRIARVTLLDEDGETQPVVVVRDDYGHERVRHLPRGGFIESHRGLTGVVESFRVGRRAALDGPAAVAETGLSLTRSFDRDAAGEIQRIRDSRLGELSLQRDAIGQISGMVWPDGMREAVAHDAAGNVLGRSSVLQPIEDQVADGLDAAMRPVFRQRGRVETFTWGADGMLQGLTFRDGSRAEYVYDAFGRRLAKWVLDDRGAIVSSTRFVWDGATLLEERCVRGASTTRRRYLYDEVTGLPTAQRDERGWLYCVSDGNGAVHHLVDAEGRLAASIERDLWGAPRTETEAPAATPLAFRGQQIDDESGLAYNRYRYFDPATGRYLSPDPLGIYGGLNAFAYAENDPFTFVDPDGLMARAVIREEGRPDIVGNSGSAPQHQGVGGPSPAYDPAIGSAHLNARQAHRERTGRDGNMGCAEIDALHQMAARVRQDARDNEEGELSRSEVRRRVRDRFRNGATIETSRGSQGMCPCPMCAQTFRELGIHPENITRRGESPAQGGVIAPNPVGPSNRGRWNGQAVWANNRNQAGRAATTSPSRTPPFRNS